MNNLNISDFGTSLIIGAGHGIGLAIVKELLMRNEESTIIATYRIESKANELLDLRSRFHHRLQILHLDPTSEDAIKELSIELDQNINQIDALINCVGLLHDEELSPEKSLKDINQASLQKLFSVNAIVTPLLAKYFCKALSQKSPSCFISISAKVGSIEDNKMGGWYGYRASKAALNMFIKTISLEFERKKSNCLVLAIHPGTTVTELSEPFIKNTKYILHQPEQTARNILNVIEGMSLEKTGSFYSWDGSELPW